MNAQTYQARLEEERESGSQAVAESLRPHAGVVTRADGEVVLTVRGNGGRLVALELDWETHCALMSDLEQAWRDRGRLDS